MPRALTLEDHLHLYRQLFKRAVEERSDYINPICMLLLSIGGIFFIYSAQSHTQGTQWVMQIVWVAISFACYLVISAINYKFFLQNAHIIYGICVIVLALLAIEALFIDIPFLVKTRFGSTRWLDFGAFQIQPSELAKIGTLLMLASALARSRIGDLRDSLVSLAIIGGIFIVPFVLIFVEPDLGSCLVLLPMVFALLYVSNLSQYFFATVLLIFFVMVLIAGWDIYRYHQFLEENNLSATKAARQNAYGSEHSWLPLKDYQRNRILGFVAPELVDPQGIGVSWNRNQSLIAAGSGGLLGKGHNQGTQAKLGYLPRSVASNDFIASVILEESGFIGGSFMLALYAILISNTLRIAHLARDRFGMLLTIGTSAIFITHLFVNVGMTVGVMPITGLPLPFVSYGGSFMIVCWILQGFVQSVNRFRRDFS